VIRHLGTGRDSVSPLDWKYRPHSSVVRRLPAVVDLRRHCPPVYDQLHLNSCSANAIAAALRYDEIREGRPHVPSPSRLFIYYNEREMEGSVGSDSGAQLRDGMKSVAKTGVCKESDFPYDIHKFKVKPPASCYENAKKSRAIQYFRVCQELAHMKACLAAGYPFVFGFIVYASFMSDETAATGYGTLPLPHDKIDGGHAVMCTGYNDAAQFFIMRKSWGRRWGRDGFFTLPYEYLTSSKLSNDFWTIRHVSAPAERLPEQS